MRLLSPGTRRRVLALVFASTVMASPLLGATLPSGFQETILAASGLPNATAIAVAPDGRVFVCLQAGQLRVIKNGVLLATPLNGFVEFVPAGGGNSQCRRASFPSRSRRQAVYCGG